MILGHQSISIRWLSSVNTQGQARGIKPPTHEALGSRVFLARADVDYRRLHRVKDLFGDNYPIYIGESLLTQTVYREHNSFTNNAYQYDAVLSLSLEA
ncbi:MAG: hypothetical protein WEC59_12105 [Salibacteraceae bacterium]